MKTLKPLAVSALHRVVEHGAAFDLVVCAVVYAPMASPAPPLPELALWTELPPLLGEAPLDDAMPRARAEVIVTGSAHTPGGHAPIARW